MASEEQLLLVELVRSVSAMRTETVMQTVKEVLKQPPAIAKDKVSILDLDPISSFQHAYERQTKIKKDKDILNFLVDHRHVVTSHLK